MITKYSKPASSYERNSKANIKQKEKMQKTPFKLWSCSALREEMHKESSGSGGGGACDSPPKYRGNWGEEDPTAWKPGRCWLGW